MTRQRSAPVSRPGAEDLRIPRIYREVPASRRIETFLVWGIWSAMTLVAATVVAIDGRNIPFAEDWFFVAPLTGNEPSLSSWLWTQNSEHLIPIPKALLLALLELTGADFRAGMVFNVVVLAALSAIMMMAARQLRGGRTRLTDAVFPLLLLHLGHWDNLLWSWQIHFVLSIALTCGLLLMVVRWRDGPATPVAAGVAALFVLILPLSGGNGTLVTPAFAVWMLYSGVKLARHDTANPREIFTSSVLVASSMVALMVVVGYLAGYQRAAEYPAVSGFLVTITTTVKFVAFGLGPAAKLAWVPVAAVALGVVVVACAVLTAHTSDMARRERLRTFGLVLLMGALALLAITMGWGRGGKVDASGYMSTRYALLATPLLAGAYFIVELHAARRVRILAQGLLFSSLLVLLPLNTHVGLQRRAWFDRGFTSFQGDLRAGLPLETLADRHHTFLMPWNRDALLQRMRMLEQARQGPWKE